MYLYYEKIYLFKHIFMSFYSQKIILIASSLNNLDGNTRCERKCEREGKRVDAGSFSHLPTATVDKIFS